MQTNQIYHGLILCVISGIMLGIFALPQKKIKIWQWENYWASFTLFSAFLFPLVIAIVTIPSMFRVVQLTPYKILIQVFLLGVAWGIANIGYGISIKKLGIALALAIVLGINNIVGTILPIIIYQPDKLIEPVGYWIISGVIFMLIGIIISSNAGKTRYREQKTDQQASTNTKSSFTSGLIIAILAGALAASFNFALMAGKPIELIAISNGAHQANSSNITWFVGLFGGFLVTLIYCVYLWKRNKSFSLFFNKGSFVGWSMTALMGMLWFGGVMLYGTSVGMLGILGASLGWPIIQSVSIGSANLIGILSGEFRGTKRALHLMYTALLFLFIGIICIGFAGNLQ